MEITIAADMEIMIVVDTTVVRCRDDRNSRKKKEGLQVCSVILPSSFAENERINHFNIYRHKKDCILGGVQS